MEDKEELPWITLKDEKDVEDEEGSSEIVDVKEVYSEYKERMDYFHHFPELNQYFYPESKEDDDPVIMDEVGIFQVGFYSSDSEFRNLTKSTLSKILKNFMIPGIDSLFVTGNVKFLARLFDIEAVREQVRAYLTSPYTIKGENLVFLLESVLKNERRLTQADKQIVTELLCFLQK